MATQEDDPTAHADARPLNERSAGAPGLIRLGVLSVVVLAAIMVLQGRAEVLVVDSETGLPLDSANLEYSWSVGDFMKSAQRSRSVISDDAGRVTVRSWESDLWFDAEHPGYYPSRLHLELGWRSVSAEIALRPWKDPQPMIGKQVFLLVPSSAREVGYDLVAGDLLPPHGSGRHADLVIRWRPHDHTVPGDRARAFEFTFPGTGNGIIAEAHPWASSGGARSDHWSRYRAPASGYRNRLSDVALPVEAVSDEGLMHYFKLRSEEAAGPLFGKLPRRPRFDSDRETGEAEFRFTYFLNPTGSANVEADRTRVTAPRLGRLEYALNERGWHHW